MSMTAPADPANVVGLSEASVSNVDFLTESDPFRIFAAWYHAAQSAEPRDPNAMALASVDQTGLPNVRMVLLKGMDGEETGRERGFVFYTNIESAKGDELIAQPRAALAFHWKSLERQVRARGMISRVSDQEANDYFASRPIGSQIGAWASAQSRPLESREARQTAYEQLTKRYEDADVPRPPHWSGFRLTPVEIEFWQAGEFRLHDRRQFLRAEKDADWQSGLLWP